MAWFDDEDFDGGYGRRSKGASKSAIEQQREELEKRRRAIREGRDPDASSRRGSKRSYATVGMDDLIHSPMGLRWLLSELIIQHGECLDGETVFLDLEEFLTLEEAPEIMVVPLYDHKDSSMKYRIAVKPSSDRTVS